MNKPVYAKTCRGTDGKSGHRRYHACASARLVELYQDHLGDAPGIFDDVPTHDVDDAFSVLASGIALPDDASGLAPEPAAAADQVPPSPGISEVSFGSDLDCFDNAFFAAYALEVDVLAASRSGDLEGIDNAFDLLVQSRAADPPGEVAVPPGGDPGGPSDDPVAGPEDVGDGEGDASSNQLKGKCDSTVAMST